MKKYIIGFGLLSLCLVGVAGAFFGAQQYLSEMKVLESTNNKHRDEIAEIDAEILELNDEIDSAERNKRFLEAKVAINSRRWETVNCELRNHKKGRDEPLDDCSFQK